MITLGVETSCDETAGAVLADGKVLSSEVSSSVHLHSRYGGVVPEIASRHHVEYIYPVARKALKDARLEAKDLDLVAVTYGPGLPGSLLVGMSFAKALSFSEDKPLVGINHVHAHVLSSFIDSEGRCSFKDKFPFIGMVISGGHTSIYRCDSLKSFTSIGRTKDDAIGEAFDKVAKVLDLGYPGGPKVEKRALRFKGEDTIPFPRALMQDKEDLDFSFSGIKTAVMYYWRDSSKTEEEIDRVCFSFQEAVIDVAVKKALRALKKTGMKRLAVGGGVINNEAMRFSLMKQTAREGIELFLPDKEYCTDNAAMIAALGEALYEEGVKDELTLNASPGVY